MRWTIAYNLATKIRGILAPHCVRLDSGPAIKIVGAVRRKASSPREIEIACVPRVDMRPAACTQLSLIDHEGEMEPYSPAFEALDAWCRAEAKAYPITPGQVIGREAPHVDKRWKTKAFGRQWDLFYKTFRAKVIIHLCTTDTPDGPAPAPHLFGMSCMVRTGPNEFGTAMMQRWRDVGRGTVDRLVAKDRSGRPVQMDTEQAVFEAFKVPYIEPSDRRDNRSILQALAQRQLQERRAARRRADQC